jgi:hypothetical protein
VTQKISYAGQFILDAIDIIQPGGMAIDIREQVEQITIYEDLFSPFLSGNLICLDTSDLPSFLLNAGADLLRLRIYTPTIKKSDWIDRYFHIYKLSDRAEFSERSTSYVFHFVSQESIIDSSVNLSKKFKGTGETNIESILKDVYSTQVPFNSSGSTNDVIYNSNNWSGTKNIRYNCEHSLAADGSPSFVFFESRAGFNFKSLTDISEQKPAMKFMASNHLSEVIEEGFGAGNVVKELNKDFYTVLKVTSRVTFDYMKDKSNGLLNSRMFSFDLVAKKIDDVTFNANTDERKRMNPNRFYKPSIIDSSYRGSQGSVLLYNQKHFNLYNGVKDATDFAYKQRRISIMRQFQQHKIEIEVLGRTDYTVGTTVTTDFNRMMPITRDLNRNQIRDPMLSGKYIVSAVCHRFTRAGKHESTIELIRDSIGDIK